MCTPSTEPLSLTAPEHRRLAEVLLRAGRNQQPVERLSERYPELTPNDAARIRDTAIACRTAAGERLIGAKAVVQAAGPQFGWLTDEMLHRGSVLDFGAFIRPAVQATVALVLGGPVLGTVETVGDLLAVTARVVPCLEIVDSRYGERDVDAVDAIADNFAAAKLVVGGQAASVGQGTLRHASVTLDVDEPPGRRHRATFPAPEGYLETLVWLANVLDAWDVLQPGAVLVAPSWTPVTGVPAGGAVAGEFAGIGRVAVQLAA